MCIRDSTESAYAKGYSLVFDVVRRFAQPLGIDLPRWENRIIKTEKGVIRLLPVKERAKQLFGEEGTASAAEWIESEPETGIQLALFPVPGQMCIRDSHDQADAGTGNRKTFESALRNRKVL